MLGRKKIEIRVSKLLMQTAVEDASATAVREELTRQTVEQIKGTRLQGGRITVDFGFDKSTVQFTTWPEIPDSDDLTFVWVD